MGKNAAATKTEKTTGESGSRSGSAKLLAVETNNSLGFSGVAENLAIQRAFGGGIVQPKLTISQPDDPYEKEADRVAHEVMRMPVDGEVPKITPLSPSVQRMCAGCEEELVENGATVRSVAQRQALEEEEDKYLQTTREANVPAAPKSDFSSYLDSMKGGGQPLSSKTRAFFEPRFGCDLSKVKVHSDLAAADSAQSIRARAFTQGSEIVFGPGEYSPESKRGQSLLAHELTHTVQQSNLAMQSMLAVQREPKRKKNENNSEVDNTESFTYDGTTVSGSQADVEQQLLAHVAKKGETEAATNFVSGFKGNYYTTCQDGGAGSEGAPGVGGTEEAARMACKLDAALTSVNSKFKGVRDKFKPKAQDILRGLLNESKVRIESERIRYGLTKEDTSSGAEGGVATDNPGKKHSIDQDSVDTKGMVAAAKALAEKRKEIKNLQDQQALVVPQSGSTSGGSGAGAVPDPNQEEFERIGTKISEASRELKILRHAFEARYPVLSSFQEEGSENTHSLDTVGYGSWEETARVLMVEINKRKANIDKVRSGLDGGELDVFTLPKIVAMTSQVQQLEQGSWQRVVVNDAMKEAKSDLSAMAIAAISIGLGLLAAIPTGGSSLAVGISVAAGATAITIDIVQLMEDLEDFEMKEALANTDFDKARSVSQDDPSLFWLGLSILATIPVVGDASDVFKTLRGPVRRALSAPMSELDDALEHLKNTSVRGGHSNLAEQAAHTVKKLRSKGGKAAHEVLGGVGEESRVVRIATENVTKEAESASVLAKVSGPDGHTITVTKNGWLVICSSCDQVRGQYATELAENPALLTRLQSAEELSRRAAKESDPLIAKQIADQAGQQTSDITRQLEKAKRDKVLEMKIKKTSTKYNIDTVRLADILSKVEMKLGKFNLPPDAITRIMRNAPHASAMKGQLFEEITAKRVREMIKRQIYAGGSGQTLMKKIEFFDGHRLTDANGNQVSDGLVGVLDGNTLYVDRIFEMKSGKPASRELKRIRASRKSGNAKALKTAHAKVDKPKEWPENVNEAINDVKEQALLNGDPVLARKNSRQILLEHRAEVEKALARIPVVEDGQIHKTFERLASGEDGPNQVFLDRGSMPIDVVNINRSTPITAVLPSDVKLARKAGEVPTSFDDLTVELWNSEVKAADLSAPFSELKKAVNDAKKNQ